MKVLFTFSALLITSMLSSCSGLFPSVGVLAPGSLVGYKMDAAGMEGSYHYEFFEDAIYRRIKIFPSGKQGPVKKGNWEWQRTSTDHAVLTLDQSLEVKLHFTTHDHANATIPSNTRLFPVEFSEPGEQ